MDDGMMVYSWTVPLGSQQVNCFSSLQQVDFRVSLHQ